MEDKFLLDIEWTDDCQGKKDYDGHILSISSRYWPRGGGFTGLFVQPGKPPVFEDNEQRPHIPPSATSTLLLRYGDDDSVELARQEFEADTQEEVQRAVEIWAQAQMDRVVAILREHFPIERPD